MPLCLNSLCATIPARKPDVFLFGEIYNYKMSDIFLKGITVDSGNLTIRGGTVNVSSTRPSNLLSGGLVVAGGIVVGSTADATSITSGGGITVAGGLSTLKGVVVGSDLEMDSPMGALRVSGISTDRLHIASTVDKNITMSPDGVNTVLSVFDNHVTVSTTTESLGTTTGALVVDGGIGCGGDLRVTRDVVAGRDMACTQNLDVGGEIDVTGGVRVLTNISLGGDLVFHSRGSVSSNTGGIVVSSSLGLTVNAASRVTGQSHLEKTVIESTDGNALTVHGTTHLGTDATVGGTLTTTQLRLSNVSSIRESTGTVFMSPAHSFFTGTRNALEITNTGIVLGGEYTITPTGSQLALTGPDDTVLDVGGVVLGNKLGNLFVDSLGGELHVNGSTTFHTNGAVMFTGAVHCSSGILVTGTSGLYGDTGITGKLQINSVCTIDTLSTNGILLSTLDNTSLKVFSAAGVSSETNVELELYAHGFDRGNTNYSVLRTSTRGTEGWLIHSANAGLGVPRRIDIATSVSSANLTVSTEGYIGIQTTSPSASLDIHGELLCDGNVHFTDTAPSTVSSAGLRVSGGLTIHCTQDANGISSGGGVTVEGGIAVHKDAYFGGVVTFMDSTPSTGYMTGAVNIRGGLTISGNAPAANIGNGGALTVAGGASIGGDLWVGGGINGSGSSSSSYAYLTLTATDEAVNFTSGALVSFGGITIQCSTDSASVTDGGSLLVRGGASFGGGLYIEGDNFFYGTQHYVTKYSGTVTRIYDNLRYLKFSVDSDPHYSITRYDETEQPAERSFEIDSVTGLMTLGATAVKITSTQNIDGGTTAALEVEGGVSVLKDLGVSGEILVRSTTESYGSSTGSVVVMGGVGVGGALNVQGNAVIAGNLTVNGTTTSIQTVDTVLKDNVILLNAGPIGSRDSGIAIQRYQLENDNGEGDVVQHAGAIAIALPDQTGVASDRVNLGVSSSSVNDTYTGWWVRVAGGFSNNQTRQIVGYNGSTRVATLSSPWTLQNPGIGDTVLLYNKPYIHLTFNELSDRFEFVSSSSDTSGHTTDLVDIAAATLHSRQCLSDTVYVSSTMPSTSTTSGAVIVTGGMGVGGSVYIQNDLVVAGKKMTPSPYDIQSVVVFEAAVSTVFAAVTGLMFSADVWGFDVWLAARLTTTTLVHAAHYHLRGVNRGSGQFELVKAYVGDDLDIDFDITSDGQVRYITPNYPDFVSLTFKFKAIGV